MKLTPSMAAQLGLLAALGCHGAQASMVGYGDLGKGAFGSISWAGNSYGSTRFDGGTLLFDSSQGGLWSSSASSSVVSSQSSGSLMDGSLHSRSQATACVDRCSSPWRLGTHAGTAMWDRVHFASSNAGDELLVPVKLHIDGLTEGGGYGMIRYLFGYDISDPLSVLDSRYGGGWQTLYSSSGEMDFVIDMGSAPTHLPKSMTIYIELETSASESLAGPSLADFGHTARIEWDLPPSVSFTSASGVFMTAAPANAVPEPQALALVALALGWLAASRASSGGRASRR